MTDQTRGPDAEDAVPTVRLERYDGPWPDDDPDANFKADIAAYSNQDPLFTLNNLADNIDVPVGALVRYVLSKWASGGSEGLLQIGPSTVERMHDIVSEATADDTDEARLAAFDQLAAIVGWLHHGLEHPDSTYPRGGAEGR